MRFLLAITLIVATTATAEACHRRGGKSAKSGGCSAPAAPVQVAAPPVVSAPLVSVTVSGCAGGNCAAPASTRHGLFGFRR